MYRWKAIRWGMESHQMGYGKPSASNIILDDGDIDHEFSPFSDDED